MTALRNAERNDTGDYGANLRNSGFYRSVPLEMNTRTGEGSRVIFHTEGSLTIGDGYMLDQRILIRHRAGLMGIAAVMIYFAHAYAFVNLKGIAASLFSLGNVGVDIFLLLTGFGMAFSFSRRPGLRAFYHKRAVRIGVPFLCLSVPYFLYADFFMFASSRATFTRFALDCSSLSYWIFHTGAWYVSMLVPLYLATPLWASFERQFSQKAFPAFIGVALSLVLYFTMTGLPALDPVAANVAFVAKRLPSFFVGFWIGSTFLLGNLLRMRRWEAVTLSFVALAAWFSLRSILPVNFLAALGASTLFAVVLDVVAGMEGRVVRSVAGLINGLGGGRWNPTY